jgi:hypothetical protein
MPREEIVGRLTLPMSVIPLLKEQLDGKLAALPQSLTAPADVEGNLVCGCPHRDPAAAFRQATLAMEANDFCFQGTASG